MSRFPAHLLLISALATAAPAAAELSKLYVDWAAGPAQYLFTEADRAAWAAISDDAAAERFVRLFWARRDPTPETPDNELRREFERRVAMANQSFGEQHEGVVTPGWNTDRGRVLILLGPPYRRQQGGPGVRGGGDVGAGETAGPGGATVSSGTGPGLFGTGGSQERFGTATEETWLYDKDKKPEWIKKKRFNAVFRSKPGTNEIDLHDGAEVMGYLGEAAAETIVSPDLSEADLVAGQAGTADAPRLFGAKAEAAAGAIEALRSAIAGGGGGTLPAHLDTGAFEGSGGGWLVPIQVSAAAAPPAGATVFGEVAGGEAAQGTVFTFDRPWRAVHGQSVAQGTVVVPAGDWTVRAGIRGADGALLWSGSSAVTVPAGEATGFRLSDLLLAEDVAPMAAAQDPLEPFAWQGIEVVPKGDRSFAHGAALWLYLHACGAGFDAAGKPTLRSILEVSGPARFRGSVRGEPVKATDHCWVVAQALDVAPGTFPPGDYSVKLTVTDTTSGTTLERSADFHVVAAP
jgi:GWxTD domain-containing protein